MDQQKQQAMDARPPRTAGEAVSGLPPYSVLMSVYAKDRAAWFEEAIECMANQSWPPEEILIVEDGPIPEELHCVEEACMNRHPGVIRRMALEKNVGLGKALHAGVEKCACEWIARMDADDVSDLTRCEKELRAAQEKNADMVGCDCTEFTESVDHTMAYRLFPESHEELIRFSRRRTPFCHPAVMMQKSAVLKAGNYQSVHLLEDYDLFVRMLARGAVGCTVKEILFHVRVSEDFYSRRGGLRYVSELLKFNARLLKKGWMSPADFLARSGGNIVVGLAPRALRIWIYRRLLRK